jgi:hypothetical protein
MAKVKIKISKEKKQLLIAMLLGDGTISSNYVFKLSHSTDQLEYLTWKVKLLDRFSIKNNGVKEYVSKTGYNKGCSVIYSQMSLSPTIKALRRSVYKPKKMLTRKLLNWLNPLGLAIWYMDDGHLSLNNNKTEKANRIRIATCLPISDVEEVLKYFKEVWNLNFNKFKEGNSTYSIMTTSENDTKKFIELIKPYILEVPSMWYKIRKRKTKQEFLDLQSQGFEVRDIMY